MSNIKPLKKRTMTLNELQVRTVDFMRLVRFQLNRRPHEEGMSDNEFIDQVLTPLETEIYQDRQIQLMSRRRDGSLLEDQP